jgi:D-alanine-D-alanine ligase-like ATP-grasp enzyme
VNENGATQNHSLPEMVHPATIATCARLVQNLGVRLAGVDIIARNIADLLSPANGYIGEINTTPGLHHHDLVAERRGGRSVAAELVGYMFETGAGTMNISSQTKTVTQLRVAKA